MNESDKSPCSRGAQIPAGREGKYTKSQKYYSVLSGDGAQEKTLEGRDTGGANKRVGAEWALQGWYLVTGPKEVRLCCRAIWEKESQIEGPRTGNA